jgi:hypothetical protein
MCLNSFLSKLRTLDERFEVNLKKRVILALTAIIVVVIAVSAFVAIESYKSSSGQVASKKPFYVGVTYCGNSTTEAKQLIDRVKSYTNLFVLQSGPLMTQLEASQEICDYAVNAGLNIILYYSSSGLAGRYLPLIDNATTRWGNHFLGVYFNDEPGGKMLDSSISLYDNTTGITVSKSTDGTLGEQYSKESNGTTTRYYYQFLSLGEITVEIDFSFPDHSSMWNTTTYFMNGTISLSTSQMSPLYKVTIEPTLWYQPDGTVQDENNTVVTGHGDISQFETYQQVWDSRPLQTYAEAANRYVNAKQNSLSMMGNQSNLKLFTSDYALYWFDYMSGYDTVWAQLGWNNSATQEIALVRGAANMQNRSWGTMITWQSNTAPYLQSGDQMYDEMRQSYESGAEYVIIFNYTPDDNPLGIINNGTRVDSGTGLLQDEHFAAMQKFWTDVVENSQETNNVTAEAVLVLPNSYGWGMRNPNDTIWGLWQVDSTSAQIWTQLQSKLAQYGSKLDIVYDDPAYPVDGKYDQTYLWNQTR